MKHPLLFTLNPYTTMKKIQYSVAMLQNQMRPEESPKAYANLQLTGVVDINEMAEHIAHHNSVFSKGTIVGILTELSVCMRELILQGYKVELCEIGTFAPTIKSEGAESKEKFNASYIKDMGVIFNEGKCFENLRQDAEFEKTSSRKVQAAALKAETEGKTCADWTPEENSEASGEQGNSSNGDNGSTGNGSTDNGGSNQGGNPSTGGSGQDNGGGDDNGGDNDPGNGDF